jgi:hypothetical protein
VFLDRGSPARSARRVDRPATPRPTASALPHQPLAASRSSGHQATARARRQRRRQHGRERGLPGHAALPNYFLTASVLTMMRIVTRPSGMKFMPKSLQRS